MFDPPRKPFQLLWAGALSSMPAAMGTTCLILGNSSRSIPRFFRAWSWYVGPKWEPLSLDGSVAWAAPSSPKDTKKGPRIAQRHSDAELRESCRCVCRSLRKYLVNTSADRIPYLVGGLEHFLFSHILGIIIPID